MNNTLENVLKSYRNDLDLRKKMVNYKYHEGFTVIYASILDEQKLHNN